MGTLVRGDLADCAGGVMRGNWNALDSHTSLRLRSLFFFRKVEQELDEELRYHLERQIDEGIASGLRPDEARHAALQSIVGIEQRKEECRDNRGTRWVEDFGKDLQYASRQFSKNKGFFVLAAATLAIGIGANTAIFSAVNSVLLRPFPYRDAERLVSVLCAEPSNGIPQMGCSLPDLQEIAARNHSFEAVAKYYWGDINILGGTPEKVSGVYVSADVFSLLGVKPMLGRTFLPSEEIFGRNRVVILSDALWRERFAGMPSAIGSTIRLNSQLFNVIGVMPRDFQFPASDAKLWMPLSFAPNDNMASRGNHFINAIARLRPGITVRQANTDVHSIARELQHQFSQNAGVEADASEYLSSVVGDVRPALLILLGAVSIVLLIACVNVANLLLSRASARQRELSVRAALGASSGRLIRQLLSESALLGTVGACLGVMLSAGIVRLILTFGPADIPRLRNVPIDATVFVFAAAVTLLSVLIFSLIPATNLARIQVGEALKDGGRSLSDSARTMRSRDVLVIIEITLSLVLLISAGLLLESFRQLRRVDPGFNPKNVLTMSVTLPASKYPETQPAQIARFYDELTKRIERLPGVKAAGASTALPIADQGGWGKYFTIEKRPASRLADVPVIQYRQVTPHFAKALEIPILAGRFFTDDDVAGRPLVAVINESARKRFFPKENPIGQRVFPGPPEATVAKLLPSPDYRFPRLTIVGVIRDVRQSGLSQPPEPELFVSNMQGTVKDNETPANKMFLFIKAGSDPLRLVNAIREIVQSLDPEQPVADVATMQERLRTSLQKQRFELLLFGGFALMALALAAVGIYGVLSYAVRLRMHEIGIRMALGANGTAILKMTVMHGLWLAMAGVLLGAILALGVTRLLSSLLFNIQATDIATFLEASLVLMILAAGASFVPSLRAARTDALTVLRAE